jgi:hypothetical protein
MNAVLKLTKHNITYLSKPCHPLLLFPEIAEHLASPSDFQLDAPSSVLDARTPEFYITQLFSF